MQRLWLLVGSVLVAGCSGKPDGGLLVQLTVDAALMADCFEVAVLGDGSALAHTSVRRAGSRNEYSVGIRRGELPEMITAEATAYLGECSDPARRKLAGRSASAQVTFPATGVARVSLSISRPDTMLDADADGYVDAQLTGADCDDTDATIHPGEAQRCFSVEDTDCDGLVGCADSDCAGVCAVALTFDPTTVFPVRSECSVAVHLQATDASGAGSLVVEDTSITFEPAGTGLTVHSDAACTSAPLAQAEIARGFGALTLYVKGSSEGERILVARGAGLASASLTVRVGASAVTQLAFLSQRQLLTAGACSEPLSVELRDALGVGTTASGSYAIAIQSSRAEGFSVHSVQDGQCVAPLPARTVAVPPGQSSTAFRVRATKASFEDQTQTLIASDGMREATQPLNVVPGEPASVVFVTAPMRGQVHACLGRLTLQLRDAFENTTRVEERASGVTVLVSGETLGFFLTETCSAGSELGGSTVIGAGSSEVGFRVRGSTPGQRTMTVNALGKSASQDLLIDPGPAASLALVAGVVQTLEAGVRSRAVTVTLRDAWGFATPAATAIPLSITAPADFSFYGDATASAALPADGGIVMAASDAGWATFHFAGTKAGANQPLRVDATGLTGTGTVQTILAGPPSRLLWNAVPPSPTSVVAGDCSTAFTLHVEDAHRNVATFAATRQLNLTSTPAGLGFSSSGVCSSSGSSVAFSGSSTAIYAKGTTAGSYALSASIEAIQATLPHPTLTVTPATISALSLGSAFPTSPVAGACAPFSVERRDQYGNLVAVGAATTFLLSTTGPPQGLEFYATAVACSSASSPVTQVTMPLGASTVQVWLRGRAAGAASVGARQASGFSGSAAGSVEVMPGPAQRLQWGPAPGTTTAGACTPFVVARVDAFGNQASEPGVLNVILGTSAPGAFFLDPACGVTAAGGVQINGGSPSTNVWYRSTVSGTQALEATSAGCSAGPCTPGTTSVFNAPAAISKVVLSHAGATLTSDDCSGAITVQAQDAYGNPSPATAALSVALASTATGAVSYYSGSSCGGIPLAPPTVTLGLGASSTTFSLRAAKAESLVVTASPPAPAAAGALTRTVNPGPPSALAWKSAPQPSPLATFTCSSTPAIVEIQDAKGNATPLTGSRSFSFTSSAPNAGLWFSNSAGCASPQPSPHVVTLSSGSQFAVYLYGFGLGPTDVGVANSGGSSLTSPSPVNVSVSGALGSLELTASNTLVEPGFCQALNLRRLDSSGQPFLLGDAAVTVTVPSATTTLLLHANSGCGDAATTTQSISIANGASNATLYARAHSGAAESAVQVSAANALLAGAQLAIMPLPLVRRGACTIATAATSVSCPVVPAIPLGELSRTLLVFQAAGVGSAPADVSVDCRLASTGDPRLVTVDCSRWGSTGGAVSLRWQTGSWGLPASAPGGVSVQHRALTPVGPGTSVTDIISSVVRTRSFLLLSTSTGDAVGFSAGSLVTGFLSSATEVSFNAGGSTWPTEARISYQVVEMADARADRGQLTSSLSGAFISKTGLPIRTVSRTAVLHAVRFADAADSTDICRKRYRGAVTANDGVEFFRGAGDAGVCTDVAPVELAWERIELPSSAGVQAPLVSILAGGSSATSVDLSTPVVPHRTLLLLSGQGPSGQSAGETGGSATASADFAWGTGFVDFDASSCDGGTCSRVRVTRASAGSDEATSVFTPFVVQFSP